VLTAPVPAALIDLDGTVYSRGVPVPGALTTVTALREAGIRLRFLTNTDSQPPAAVCDRLARMGLEIDPAELFTPVAAAERLLSEEGTGALLVVSEAVRPVLARFVTDAPPSHVVVGDCRDVLDYPLLDSAYRALSSGAELVALQRGRYFRAADGNHLDTGAVVAALEYAAGTSARVVGKPAADFFALAARSAGCLPEECVVVGDDATTDVAGGRAIGARTVQVRTGKYADQQREDAVPAADQVIDSIAGLPALLGVDSGGSTAR
jgi:HAD superfamily hydrolase (TIGR01458 family)